MHQVNDTINGKPINLVHSAAVNVLQPSLGKREYRKAVLAHLQQTNASHAICILDGDLAVWRASYSRGESFAAALEHWLPTSKLSTRTALFYFVIPLDKRIYIAKIENHTVQQESCTIPEKALTLLTEANSPQTPIVVLNTEGQTKSELVGLSHPSDYDINLKAFNYSPIWLTFLKQKLPHTFHAIPLVALLLLPLTLYFGEPEQEPVTSIAETIIPEAMRLPDVYNAAHPLLVLFNFLKRDNITPLANSVKTLTLTEVELTIYGKDSNSFPAAAALFAKENDLPLILTSTGWQITIPTKAPPYTVLKNHLFQDTLKRIMGIHGGITSSKITTINDSEQTLSATINLQLEKPAPHHFRDIAQAVADKPVSITSLRCALHRGHPQNCQLVLSITGTKKS